MRGFALTLSTPAFICWFAEVPSVSHATNEAVNFGRVGGTTTKEAAFRGSSAAEPREAAGRDLKLRPLINLMAGEGREYVKWRVLPVSGGPARLF